MIMTTDTQEIYMPTKWERVQFRNIYYITFEAEDIHQCL